MALLAGPASSEKRQLEDQVREWRKNPFNPHLIARMRTTAYQKAVVMKYLDNLSEDEILELNIPTAVPLVYEFDENFKPLKRYYLGDQDEIAAKAAAVANQGKAK